MLDGRKPGEIVEGIVVGLNDDGLLVDIGARSEALLPLSEVPRTEVLGTGATVLAHVMRVDVGPGEDQEGRVVLSFLLTLTQTFADQGWRRLERCFDESQTVEGDVLEHRGSGLVVSVEGVRGFVPLSQIADVYRDGQNVPLSERLKAMRGRTLTLKVIEIHRRRNRLILSERAALKHS